MICYSCIVTRTSSDRGGINSFDFIVFERIIDNEQFLLAIGVTK